MIEMKIFSLMRGVRCAFLQSHFLLPTFDINCQEVMGVSYRNFIYGENEIKTSLGSDEIWSNQLPFYCKL